MDFGKVASIEGINFSLPEVKFTTNKATFDPSDVTIYVGASVWTNKNWIGEIYPNSVKASDYLKFYAKQFSCIELNSTFYALPDNTTIQKWKNSVDKSFKFCPKFPKIISHEKELIGCDRETAIFLEQIMQFEVNLGVSFLQLSPNFSPQKYTYLQKYIEGLPKNLNFAVEFRHPGWFEENRWRDVCQFAENQSIGVVITDTAGRRDVVHMCKTNSTLTIRFVAIENTFIDQQRIKNWIEKISIEFIQNTKDIYIFAHTLDNNNTPRLVDSFIEHLNNAFSKNIKRLHFQVNFKQTTLF